MDAGIGSFKNRRDTARFNQTMQNRVRQEYAYQVVSRQQRALGRSVKRQRPPGGEIDVTIAAPASRSLMAKKKKTTAAELT